MNSEKRAVDAAIEALREVSLALSGVHNEVQIGNSAGEKSYVVPGVGLVVLNTRGSMWHIRVGSEVFA